MTSLPRHDAGGALVAPETPIDLTNCDREPIHVIGHVQPFGAVLVLRGPELVVAQASANAAALLGTTPGPVVGARLDALLGPERAARVAAADGRPVRLQTAAGALLATVRPLGGDRRLLELEVAGDGEPMTVDDFAALVRHTVARVERAGTLVDAAHAIAERIRVLTGFDRVWVYRFHDDWHGEVIAESRDEAVADSWLGLHYPASDIPAPARAMFLRQTIRVIADARYEPAPIEPARDPHTGEPLDLGDCVSRGVSPMHREYLRNMGVRASTSISLLREPGAGDDGGGRVLWGLVSCHHYAGPHAIAHDRRAACELLAQAFSARIAATEAIEAREQAVHGHAIHAQLVDRLAREDDLVAALVDGVPSVLDLTRAEGAAVCLHGATTLAGRTPPPDALDALVTWLDAADRDLVRTDTLGTVYPPAAAWSDAASGLLALSIGGPGDWLLWFRPELRQVVAWGGDPRKPMTMAAGDVPHLSPRSSFARWEEEVRGRSAPWHRAEVEAALALRGTLADLLLARAARIEALNRELTRSNEELDAFAYVASHDLKEPLRGIHNFAAMVREDHGDALGADASAKLDTIARLSRRLDEMVDALFHFSRVGRLELDERDVALGDVLDDALERLVAAPGRHRVTVRVPRALPTVRGDRGRLAEVLFNLLSNAMKYSRPDGGFVEVGWVAPGEPMPDSAPAGTAPPAFYVRDDGIGIDPRHHETVFRLYKRLHVRDAYEGTGAGLTIVRKIVERHGGKVWIDSALGLGTTVWFTVG
ncbi:MAG: GAF domain-containing protein [Gemmatirosa sp.]|nr:GAF domain-containing protein [Gemmatirosa sp.]